MPKYRCHFCDRLNGLILLLNNETLCPRCASTLGYFANPIPVVNRLDLKNVTEIDINGSLDEIINDLITFFVYHGMSITDVAKQLGITRSTVYSKLKKKSVTGRSLEKFKRAGTCRISSNAERGP